MTSSDKSPPQTLQQSSSSPTVALVGNPNCGKTTLFNSLTGSNYKVANYPGVTVEKKTGTLTLPHGISASLIDLPGTYALSGTSLDEKIVTHLLQGSITGEVAPTLVVAVIDATNIERNLFLISELIDAKFPLIIALNMMDIAEAQGIKVYSEILARSLDVPVIPIIARSKKGLDDLKLSIARELLHPTRSRKAFGWLPESHALAPAISKISCVAQHGELDPHLITAIATLRYAWIRSIVSKAVRIENAKPPSPSKLDAILTSKIWGLPIFFGILALMFQGLFMWAQAPMELISSIVEATSSWLTGVLPSGMLTRLLAEGIVPGVGNVIVFVPQIAILFFFIGILEDSGYLSRAAFLLDNFMKRFGLQGRAFIPLLSSMACAVPGILATRTIPTKIDRLTTILVAPLMGCSARLPVYTVLIAATIPPLYVGGWFSLQALVLLGMYLLGISGACVMAWLFNKILRRKESCFFVMEMPPIRKPVVRVVLRNVYDSVLSFLRNATTVILACSVIIWFLASFPKPSEHYQGNPVEISFAGRMGKLIEPAIRPLGFNWEIGFSIIASFPAREVFVTSLSTVLNVGHDDGDDHRSLIKRLQDKNQEGSFSLATALALMVFYVFACQCMSTLAVCRRETGSWRWTLGMFGYMTALAYVAALLTYQISIRIL